MAIAMIIAIAMTTRYVIRSAVVARFEAGEEAGVAVVVGAAVTPTEVSAFE